MELLGQRLRKAREAKGWTAEELAARLKIHVKYFQAIESGDTASLPGSFFYRSFVRQYAEAVGLPEESYADELNSAAQSHLADVVKGTAEALPTLEYQVPPMPTYDGTSREETKRWVWRVALLVIVVAISSAGYMLWQRWKSFEEERRASAQSQVASQAATQQPVQTAPQSQPASQPEQVPPSSTETGQPPTQAEGAAQIAANQPQAVPATTTGPQATAQAPAPTQSAPAQPVPAQPAPAQPAPAQPAKPGAVSISLVAKEDVWVDVWSDGRRIHSNIIPAGQTKSFSGGEMLRIRYGNAGGMDVQWNGKGVESPGPRGQVRTWEYLPGSYRMVPVPPKLPPTQQ